MTPGGSFGVAVKAAIVRGSRLLVLYQTREEARSGPDPGIRVDLPGGRVAFGESPSAALRREVAEETGLAVEPGAPIQTWSYVTDQFQLVGIDYLCEYRSGEVVLSDEHERFAWLTEQELQRLHPEVQEQFAAAYRHAGPGSRHRDAGQG
jgi:8-oxo-dGTP diphosphatase